MLVELDREPGSLERLPVLRVGEQRRLVPLGEVARTLGGCHEVVELEDREVILAAGDRIRAVLVPLVAARGVRAVW